MASEKQRQAAPRNVRKAQAGAKRKKTLKKLPSSTKTALGKEAARLEVQGRSKIGKDELGRAIARAR